MECLKCGRETVGAEVFCADCLKDMARSPVSSNTPVVIHRREESKRKLPQKKAPKPEEIIAGLHKTIKRLWIALALVSVLLCAASLALGFLVWTEMEDPDMGFNYSTVTYPSEGGRR